MDPSQNCSPRSINMAIQGHSFLSASSPPTTPTTSLGEEFDTPHWVVRCDHHSSISSKMSDQLEIDTIFETDSSFVVCAILDGKKRPQIDKDFAVGSMGWEKHRVTTKVKTKKSLSICLCSMISSMFRSLQSSSETKLRCQRFYRWSGNPHNLMWQPFHCCLGHLGSPPPTYSPTYL